MVTLKPYLLIQIIHFYILDTIAVVESAKGATDVYSPVTGKVMQVNSSLTQRPSLLNKSAEDSGWICEVETDNSVLEKSNLLSREGYEKFCKGSK